MENTELKLLDTMQISEIDRFGSNIQEKINIEMGKLISSYKTVDVGVAGEQLTELSIAANSATSKLSKTGPMMKISKFIGRFDTVENKLDQIINGITGTKDKLDMVMDNMLESRECIKYYITSFEPLEKQLSDYIERLENSDDSDSLRVQSAVNRLKTLTASRVIAEQSFIETTMLIGQTQEVKHQIDEMLTNIVPIFKMKLVNALSIKVHKEALDLKTQVTKISEKLIIDNALNIEKNTETMLKNRQTAIINPETLIEANEILQRVVSKTVEACTNESEVNKEVINKLNEASRVLHNKASESELMQIE